jgi:Uma2 family endonuclease
MAGTTTPSAPAPPVPYPAGFDGLFRVTLDQYHRMGESGVLTPEDRVELLEGILLEKPVKKSPHRMATKLTVDVLTRSVPAGWYVDSQEPITLDDSEPEPDVCVIRGTTRDYATNHPGPGDVALVVEVADSSLDRDKDWKRRVYARNAVPVYWIVNLVDGVLEVYADPSGRNPAPDYATARTLTPADRVEVVIDGTVVASVAVSEMFP